MKTNNARFYATFVVSQTGPRTFQVMRLRAGQRAEGIPSYMTYCSCPTEERAIEIADALNKQEASHA